MKKKLILASASARRRRLLAEAGHEFEIVVPDVDEELGGADVATVVKKNALKKNRHVAKQHPDSPVLAADTAIEFRGDLIGKPSSLGDACECLLVFSGETHSVFTGVAFSMPNEEPVIDVSESRVTFRKLDDIMIVDYFSKVNPMDKAGSYDIGQHGALIVESYIGSRSNIIGLPMEIVGSLLAERGL